MKKVSDILRRKGTNIISVSSTASVIDALRLMSEHNIGSIAVMDGEKYLGLMTERDYSRKVVLNGKSSTNTRITEIMTTVLPRVSNDDTIEYCMQLMSENNIRYLPVFNENIFQGLISINDLVKETIRSQEETINDLKDYLHANS
jgi:CBS domain-containing protein